MQTKRTFPHSATLCTRGYPARPYASVRPSPLLEPTRVSGVSANQRGPPRSEQPHAPSHHSTRGQRGFCLSVDSFPSLHSHPNPSSLSTDDDAATTSPSTPTRSSSRSRGANSMTYCRHCSRGLTKKAKFSHNVPSATKDQNGMLGLTDKSTLRRSIEQKNPSILKFRMATSVKSVGTAPSVSRSQASPTMCSFQG